MDTPVGPTARGDGISHSRGISPRFVCLSVTLAGLILMTTAVSTGRMGQDEAAPCAEEKADPVGDSSRGETSRDLFCMELTPVPRFPGASGMVELRHPPGPFTVSPKPDGRLRYEAIVRTDDLPPLDSLGDFSGYAVWVAGPAMFPVERLGALDETGRIATEIAMNQFILLIAAEGDDGASSGEGPGGPIVLRGQSPSLDLRPADFLEFALGAAPVVDAEDGHEMEPSPAASRSTRIPTIRFPTCTSRRLWNSSVRSSKRGGYWRRESTRRDSEAQSPASGISATTNCFTKRDLRLLKSSRL